MLRRLAKETVIYGFGHASQQILALLTLPLFARLLSPADYGLMETIGTISAVLGILASLQLTGGMHRQFFLHVEQDRLKAHRAVITALLAVVVLDVVIMTVVWPWCEPMMRYLQGGPGSGRLLQAGLLALMATTILSFIQEIHRLERRPWHYVAISLVGALIWIVCGLYLVYWARLGLSGYLWGGTLAVALTLPVALFSVRKDLLAHPLWGTFDWDQLKAMLHYSLPWIPTAASAWLITLADRLVLNHWVGLDDIGQYGIAQKAVRTLSYVNIAFSSAWSPFIFSLYAQDPEKEKHVRADVTTLYLFGLSAVTVLMTAAAPWLITLLASAKFLPASDLVGPLCLGVIGFSVTNTLSTGLCLIAETGYVAAFTGISGILNIGLNLLLVPRWGVAGSAWATAISYAILNVLYYVQTQRSIPTPFALRRLLTTSAITVGAILALGHSPGAWARLGVVAGFFALVWILGGVDRSRFIDQSRQGWTYLQARLGRSPATAPEETAV